MGVKAKAIQAATFGATAEGRAPFGVGLFNEAKSTSTFVALAIVTALLKDGALFLKSDGTVALAADLPAGGFKLTGLAPGVATTDSVTWGQVQDLLAGIRWKESAVAATTAALPASTYANGAAGVGATITASANGALPAIDGVAITPNARVLVKDQVAALADGIYVATDLGSAGSPWILTRSTDADNSPNNELTMAAVFVEAGGAVNQNTGFVQTATPIVVGVTAQTWTVFTGTQAITFQPPGNVVPGDAIAEGVAVAAARSDHTHGVPASAPTITVKSEATGAGSGVGNAFLRSDAQFQAATAAPGTTIKSDAAAAAQGAASSLLRSDAALVALTAVPGTTIKSEATAAGQGVGSSLLRSDAQIQAATAAPVDAGIANAQGASSSLARADHVHKSPKVSALPADQRQPAAAPGVPGADGQAAGPALAATPFLGTRVSLSVNGEWYTVGNGSKLTECYFSADGGATAKTYATTVAGDVLYWNGVVSGFDLAVTDLLSVNYLALP